jgi:DNA invertase Pin-like site-specific DNA recombinase
MPTERPIEIKAHHLARTAVVYVRQSTEEQVHTHTGSTEYQRQQRRYPEAWGWQPDAIEINERDLGLSGSAGSHRPGYQRLRSAIDRGDVGAIFLADMTRGGRDAAEWLLLLERCRAHQVLIVVDGKVYDVNDNAERLLAQLQATLAEYDNVTRRDTMMRGRLTKAANGRAVSAPPAGYVRQPDGSWQKDPDPTVQAAIAAVFRTFREQRSCQRTVRTLKAHGVRLPRRRRTGLRWVEPQIETIYWILAHPAYKGEYHYRRQTGDPRAGRDGRGRIRLRPALPDQVITTRDHHEPYVSAGEWHEIQTVLKLNGPSPTRRNLGPGSALCQGIVRCGLHREWAMVSAYKAARRDSGRSHAYYCQGDYRFGGDQCGRIPGELVDRAVVAALIDRLSPPRLEVVREAARRAGAGKRSSCIAASSILTARGSG